MKTWKLTVNEDELRALIDYHHNSVLIQGKHDVERSARIHDLTKRLNRETPEIENDPRPKEKMPTPEPQTTTWS